jgi:SAM-dependent methyltransferase
MIRHRSPGAPRAASRGASTIVRHVRTSKPPLRPQTTTLWDYPSQHYGTGLQGDPSYVGATPSYVIWNLLQRYTRPGDLVVDPMCGSGTTLDVAAELGRLARGFDVQPYRDDIEAADARELPLQTRSVDFVFIDPPYGDHIDYGAAPDCIGKLSAMEEPFFEALDAVIFEAHRVLKPNRYIALYACDFFNKKQGFAPIGARLMANVCSYFEPIDHVCVVRHNKGLKKGNWHEAAERDNFFLRGFNHLIIGKKID